MEKDRKDRLAQGLIALCRNYDEVARRAYHEGRKVFIPAAYMPKEIFFGLKNHPEEFFLESSNEGEEPAYASLHEALKGRNKDCSRHAAFFVLDVSDLSAPRVIDYISRDGNSYIEDRTEYKNYRFNNNASSVGFIGKNSLEEVIERDTKELQEIGGSFDEIADRMSYLVDQIENVYMPSLEKRREDIFRKYGFPPNTDILEVPGREDDETTLRGKIEKEIREVYSYHDLIPGETEIEVVNIILTRGFQVCPFEDCKGATSSRDYIIRNRRTGRELTINPLTAHLAREHHLLEKENQYGISASDFYKHFMPKKNN